MIDSKRAIAVVAVAVSLLLGYLLFRQNNVSARPEGRAKPSFQSISLAPASRAETTKSNEANTRPTPAADTSAQPPIDEAFAKARDCHVVSKQLRKVEDRLSLCAQHEPKNDAYFSRCRPEIESDQAQREKYAALKSACSVETTAGSDAEYFNSTRAAAKNGNNDAQLCFMQDDFVSRPRSDVDVAEYDRDASAYLDLALNRGDWRAVALMAIDPHYLSHSETLLRRLVPGDTVTAFQMNRLLRKAARGHLAVVLDSDGRDMLKSLSDQQAMQADAWAHTEYDNYFRQSGELRSMPIHCGGSPGL